MSWHSEKKIMIQVKADDEGLLNLIAKAETQIEELTITVSKLKQCLRPEVIKNPPNE